MYLIFKRANVSFKIPSAVPKSKWTKGLSALNRLWARGLFPGDLDRHYFLHWFVVYNGNIIQTAKALNIHRNTIQGHFLQLGYSKKSVKLRHHWQRMTKNSRSAFFEKNFHAFYRLFSGKSKLSVEENTALIGLWQTKFPFKTLTPHYLLWAIRSGKPKDWVEKRMGYSYRHKARLLSQLINPKSRDGFWLSPLKPHLKEIYSARYRTILSHRK